MNRKPGSAAIVKYCLSFFTLLLLLQNTGFGQSNYYIYNDALKVGSKVIDRGNKMNSNACHVETLKGLFVFTPYEVSEYGFKNGRVFISRKVEVDDNVQCVFLERLTVGEFNLYCYYGRKPKQYFIEKDSTLFREIIHNNDKTGGISIGELDNHSEGCEGFFQQPRILKPNKKLLTELFSRYNQCDLGTIPFTRAGVFFSTGFAKITPTVLAKDKYPGQFNSAFQQGFEAGVFIESPLLSIPFSFYSGVSLSNYEISSMNELNSSVLDVLGNLTSIHLPLQVKYIYPLSKQSIYVTTGAKYSFRISKTPSLYQSVQDSDIVEINKIEDYYALSDHALGAMMGAGIDIYLSYRRILNFELTYQANFGLSNSHLFNLAGITIKSAINL